MVGILSALAGKPGSVTSACRRSSLTRYRTKVLGPTTTPKSTAPMNAGVDNPHCSRSLTMVAPPLTVTKAEVDEGIDALDGALTALEASL